MKQLDVASPPWLAGSEFSALDDECRRWNSELPNSLQFTPAAIYIRSETGEFGALCSLHASYHLTIIDLYRIFVPALYKLRGAFTFPGEQQGFVQKHQRAIYTHARSLAEIAREALSRSGPRALADFWWPTVLFESCRHLIYHETQLQSSEQTRRLRPETFKLVESNMKALQDLQCLNAMAEPLYTRACKLLHTATSGSHEDPDDLESSPSPSPTGTPAQSAPDYVLHPLSIYRMARKGIPEKHAPEKTTSSIASQASPSSTARRMYPESTGSPQLSYLSESNTMSGQPAATQEDAGQPPGINFADPSLNPEQELQLFFPPDLTTFWQPADTIAESGYTMDMPPWMGGFQQSDPYLDFWPGNQ